MASPYFELAYCDAFPHPLLRCILTLLISKTAVSTSWPVRCVKVHTERGQLAKHFMSTSCQSFGSASPLSWRDLYRLALFEADRKNATTRIAQAERALVLRERELFAEPRHSAELDAVNAALHSLEALKSCLGIKRSVIAA